MSGGCIEDDIVERSRREGPYVTRPQTVTYGVSADDARKYGLPCGGTIQLVLEPLTAKSRIGELLGVGAGRPAHRASPRVWKPRRSTSPRRARPTVWPSTARC